MSEAPWKTDPLYADARDLLERAMGKYTIAEIDAGTVLSKGTSYRLHRGDKVARESTLRQVVEEITKLIAPPPPTKEPSMPDTPAAPVSREALKQQRVLFTLLEDHYVEGESRYEPEWSDERIAEEVGLSVAFVAEAREAGFGPVGDPVVTGIENRADALEKRIISVRDSLTELVSETLQELHDGLNTLRQEIKELRESRT